MILIQVQIYAKSPGGCNAVGTMPYMLINIAFGEVSEFCSALKRLPEPLQLELAGGWNAGTPSQGKNSSNVKPTPYFLHCKS